MSLYLKLKSIIADLEELARENMLLFEMANKSKDGFSVNPGSHTLSFTSLSKKTIDEINSIEEVIKDIKLLSRIINVSGSLRMLTQKYMKLVILYRLSDMHIDKEEYKQIAVLFYTRLEELMYTPFNDSVMDNMLISIKEDWDVFTKQVEEGKDDLETLVTKNDHILNKIQFVVQTYQHIAG